MIKRILYIVFLVILYFISFFLSEKYFLSVANIHNFWLELYIFPTAINIFPQLVLLFGVAFLKIFSPDFNLIVAGKPVSLMFYTLEMVLFVFFWPLGLVQSISVILGYNLLGKIIKYDGNW